MRTVALIAFVLMLEISPIRASAAQTAPAAPAPAASHAKKNWAPPAEPIYAQTVSDQIMAQHSELLSVTLHGTPPGTTGIYTMFAGSYPDRIGNPDDPDDIDVITKGITIVDPRWHRTNDATKKIVVQLPLRDAAGENVGLLVLAYRATGAVSAGTVELDFFRRAVSLRDELQRKIPKYSALFEPAPRVPAAPRVN